MFKIYHDEFILPVSIASDYLEEYKKQLEPFVYNVKIIKERRKTKGFENCFNVFVSGLYK